MDSVKKCPRPKSPNDVFYMGRSARSPILMIALCCIALTYTAHSQDERQTEPTYATDIYPLFQAQCAKCHTKKTRGGLSVNTREAVLKGGKSGKVVLPGESQNSLLYKMVIGQEDVKQMPRKRDPLNDQELKLIKKWIDQGAK